MLNVLFSTTRQWNVGDEFILFGAINLIKSSLHDDINPIIYNRHPDLRTDLKSFPYLDNIKFCTCDELSLLAEANFRIGFRDNSFKLSLDGQFIDLVVFAGTPEWSNNRCLDLYLIIEKFNLPVIALGIGNCIQDRNDIIMRNLNRFQLFTVRSPELIDSVKNELSVEPQYLPCPSLCSAQNTKIHNINEVKNIGFIYSCDISRSEINNCVSVDAYNYLLKLFKKIIDENKEYHFSLICHYVDELPFAFSDFPNIDILYSFDSKDYYDIYNKFDLVIGARIHGVGCAASMGIPGICVSHDFRGETVKGFFAETISINQSLDSALEIFNFSISNIYAKNKRLVSHIQKVKDDYRFLISSIKLQPKFLDNYNPQLCPPICNIFDKRNNLLEALRELRGIPNLTIAEKEHEIEILNNQILEKNNLSDYQAAKINEQSSIIERQNQKNVEQATVIEQQSQKIAEQATVIEQQTQKNTEQAAVIEQQSQKNAEQAAVIEQQTQKNAEQTAVIEQQSQKIAKQVAVIKQKTQKNTEQTAAIEQQNFRLCEQLQAIGQYKAQIQALYDEIKENTERMDWMQQQIGHQKAEIEALYNSKSWKITAPLRGIFSFIRKILKGKC